jgi:hypothetical protein
LRSLRSDGGARAIFDGRADLLVVHDFDRLGRDIRHMLLGKGWLKKERK